MQLLLRGKNARFSKEDYKRLVAGNEAVKRRDWGFSGAKKNLFAENLWNQ